MITEVGMKNIHQTTSLILILCLSEYYYLRKPETTMYQLVLLKLQKVGQLKEMGF